MNRKFGLAAGDRARPPRQSSVEVVADAAQARRQRRALVFVCVSCHWLGPSNNTSVRVPAP